MSAAGLRANAILKRLPEEGELKVAELGVFIGQVSFKLVQSRPNLMLWMVDKWPSIDETSDEYKATKDFHSHMSKETQDKYMRQAQKAIRGFEDRAIILRKWTHEAVDNFEDESLDLVFIDADHSYAGVKRDIKDWWPKVKKGGWLCGHDYANNSGPWEFGVTQAVDEWVRENGHALELDANYTWFVRK